MIQRVEMCAYAFVCVNVCIQYIYLREVRKWKVEPCDEAQLIAASEQRLEPQAQLFDCTPATPLILFMAAGLKQQHTRADTFWDFCTIVCDSPLIPEGEMFVFSSCLSSQSARSKHGVRYRAMPLELGRESVFYLKALQHSRRFLSLRLEFISDTVAATEKGLYLVR